MNRKELDDYQKKNIDNFMENLDINIYGLNGWNDKIRETLIRLVKGEKIEVDWHEPLVKPLKFGIFEIQYDNIFSIGKNDYNQYYVNQFDGGTIFIQDSNEAEKYIIYIRNLKEKGIIK